MQVILPDGSFSHFVKRHAAYEMVRERKADWADDSHRTLYKVSDTVAAKRNGFHAGFTEVWKQKQSGIYGSGDNVPTGKFFVPTGVPVWQMESA